MKNIFIQMGIFSQANHFGSSFADITIVDMHKLEEFIHHQTSFK